MKRIFSMLLALTLLLSSAAADKVLWVQGATSDRVHLRAGASADAQSLGLYYTGAPAVQLAPAQNGWIKVEICAVTGYMHQDYLSDTDYVQSLAPVYLVSNSHSTWVNLRSQPSTRSTVMGTFDNGTRVTVMGETADGWSYVRTAFGDGYMMTDMLQPAGEQHNSAFADAQTIDVGTTIVGYAFGGDPIHRYIADYGQEIFFTSIHPAPTIMKHDVNFDGHDDLVIYTSMGSSCLFCQFYVFHDGMYKLVTTNGFVTDLCNYTLYPGKNIVLSRSNNGYAGALFIAEIYRWDESGTQLQLLRRAVSDDLTVSEFTPEMDLVTTIYADTLHVEIRDFTAGEYEGTLIHEADYSHDALNTDWFDSIDAILWQGL